MASKTAPAQTDEQTTGQIDEQPTEQSDEQIVVNLPKRRRKNGAREYTAAEVASVIAKLRKSQQGEGIAFDKNLWLDTEGKARSRAREMALLIVKHPDNDGMGQPRTHVVPHPQNGQTNPETGQKYPDRWTPVVSPKR